MNPYVILASGTDTTSSTLAARLEGWHDAMVAHERQLRTRRTGEVCDEECPHVEARMLWPEALAAFGERAHGLTFLRSRATRVEPDATRVTERRATISPPPRSQHRAAEAEL